jgi:hypothetical protein
MVEYDLWVQRWVEGTKKNINHPPHLIKAAIHLGPAIPRWLFVWTEKKCNKKFPGRAVPSAGLAQAGACPVGDDSPEGCKPLPR